MKNSNTQKCYDSNFNLQNKASKFFQKKYFSLYKFQNFRVWNFSYLKAFAIHNEFAILKNILRYLKQYSKKLFNFLKCNIVLLKRRSLTKTARNRLLKVTLVSTSW